MEQRPYIIFRTDKGWGFWSNFFCILHGFDFAARNQLIPVVDMERHPTRYNEDDLLHGTLNSWEYYFEQPTPLSLAEALTKNPVEGGGEIFGPFTPSSLITPPERILSRGRELIRQYIRIKPNVTDHLDAILPTDEKSNYLGVHVRGTDQRSLCLPEHPIPNTVATYLEQTKLLDQEYQYDGIFLACDEQETLDLFQKHFGSKLIHSSAHRSSANSPCTTTISYDWLFSADRKHHRYLLGLEVLIDALLLARCKHLACGPSNVSRAAMYFAPQGQIVHPITPLWLSPPQNSRSTGRKYLHSLPPLAKPPSIPTLLTQIDELHNIIGIIENSRCEQHESLREEMARIQHSNLHHEKTVAKLKEKNAALQHKLKERDKHIKRLQERLSQLLNRWTRLGWNLMPWTKPGWRHQPLK